MLFSLGDSIPLDGLETVTSPEELVAAQDSLSQIRVSPEVADYLVALVGATRSHPMVRMGASPRASRALFRAAGPGPHGGPLLRYPGRHPGPDPPRAGPPAAAHQRGPALRCHR